MARAARACPAKRLPLSSHPAFVPLVATWLAALLGGCVAVLPAADLAALAEGADKLVLAGAAALIGGGLGWIAARLTTAIQQGLGRQRPAQPAAFVTRLLEETSNAELAQAALQPADEGESAPGTGSRHGKAVRLLRTSAPSELAMPQLVERFAVALEDRRTAEGKQPGKALSPDMAFELLALRNHLHRAALARG
ncbi:hypothetical protein [Altererythrobacter sp. Z27]|uniref:hypothetical protein n=1 Tax=Altererythrobacter sp. Z27 TaxID=3461147 RepID=UPI0040446F2E